MQVANTVALTNARRLEMTTEADAPTTIVVAIPDPPALPAEVKALGPLHTDHGDTAIAEQVVQKIAGMACREVRGVYGMGNAARRALSSISERIPGSQVGVAGGVSVQKGERQTAIEVSVVVEFGVSIVEVSQAIRRNVIAAVEHGTGLEVTEVNINVTDVHLPDDERPAVAPVKALA
jgi:uncharacterized alkaline shock family protein YloU